MSAATKHIEVLARPQGGWTVLVRKAKESATQKSGEIVWGRVATTIKSLRAILDRAAKIRRRA